MKTTILAALAFLAVSTASPAAPRLVVSTTSLTPESKIDLVLDQPVIETSEIGKTTVNDWLAIQPAWPGKLRWRAQNIAEFQPDQPPLLGVKYTVAIAAGHKHLDASPVPEGTLTTLTSDSFRICAWNCPNRWNQDFSMSTASWMLVFNDDVDVAKAVPFVSFVSKNGQRVAAKITQVSVKNAGYFANQYPSWSGGKRAEAEGNAPDAEVPNIVMVQPEKPLPVDVEWQLSLAKGLPNRSATATLPAMVEYSLGSVDPFTAGEIRAVTTANEPRRIRIEFNHPLPKALPADFLEKYLTISPRPETLTVESEGRSLVLTGSLESVDRYNVGVHGNLESRDGHKLVSSLSKSIVFQRLEPLVAFPSEDAGQLAYGQRKYRLLTQNLQGARLRIKKLAGADLVRAFQGYRTFTGNGPDGTRIERTAPVPYSMVLGKVLCDKEIAEKNGIDTYRIQTLDWNDLLPKELRCGVLFVEASGQPLKVCSGREIRTTQALVQLTDIGLAWKINNTEALVYAFSCQTGAPLPGVKFELFGEDAVSLRSAVSDASGLATLPRMADARHLLATLGEDAYITAFDSTMSTVGLWHFPVRYSWDKPDESSRTTMMFTDRSLYRPGETVRLKGIVRTLRGNAVESGTSGTARLVILDPQDKEVLTKSIEISANGSFDFVHQLAPGVTGTHMVRLEFPEELALVEKQEENDGDAESSGEGDEEMSWSRRQKILDNARFSIPLEVEEFRRNAFEITQEMAAPAVGAASVGAKVSAKYYQGQPVGAGKVKYFSRVTSQNMYPERFRDYLFCNHRSYDYGYWYHYFGYKDNDYETDHGSQLGGETVLGPDGSAALSVEIPSSDFPSPREVTVSTEVTDANNQTLVSRGSVTVHPSSVYVGVSRNDSLCRVGAGFSWRVVAVDVNGNPFAKPLKLSAIITRDVNSTTRTENDWGATSTRNDVKEETVSASEFVLDPAASAKDGQVFGFTPKNNGLHYLTLRGTDPEGRPVVTCSYFYVYGAKDYPWEYEDGLRIKLIPEKKSYKPGETARILVLSPIEGTALVTVEREKVLRSFLVDLKSDKPVVEVPVGDAEAPNAYVSVLVVKGSRDSSREFRQPQLRLGICELLVEERLNRLDVAFVPPAESYRPGEEVSLSGKVKLADGSPAANAEVTLYAEDEGTLAVMGYDTPDPMGRFYAPRNLTVDAGTSFESFVAEDPGQQTFNIKGLIVGGGGDLGKLADLMRKNFDPCATWAPALVTGADGVFQHKFKLPDTLTRYRVIAIVHQNASRFGRAETSVVAKKDLMLEPKAPRFANQSDVFHPQVLVQNASKYEGTWRVDYKAHDATGTPVCSALGETGRTITLAAGASGTLVFPTVAAQTGEAVLSWKAVPVSMKSAELTPQLSARLSDAVECRFPVQYPMPLIRQVKFVKLDRPGQMGDLRKALDEKWLDGSGSVDLEFSRSPLVDAAGSVDFLLHYPYGCVEQTTSSLVPWCVVEALRGDLPALAKYSPTHVKSAIQGGIDRLLSMQVANGGFGYWQGDVNAVDWATPYAGLGLVLAAKAGGNVPESAMESMKQCLIADLRGMAQQKNPWQLEIHARALLVLAMAGAPQEAYQNALADRLPELSQPARAMLAAAMAKGAAGKETQLQAARNVLTSKVPLPKEDSYWMAWREDRALDLIAWTMIHPGGSESGLALDRMLRDRSPYGHWRTTWVNGWSLVAMGLYAEHEKDRSEVATLTLDAGDATETIRLSTGSPTATRHFPLGPNLKLGVAADSNAYARISLACKPAIMPVQPVAKNGLSIDRIYHLVNADGSSKPLTEPKVGDLIRVMLRVTLPNDDSRYLVVEDMLPASFETVNTDFKSQGTGLQVRTSENDWTISHSELRSDRALFFFDHVYRSGSYTITYLARCTVAGQTIAPPAKVESMYDPDEFALSASRVFKAE